MFRITVETTQTPPGQCMNGGVETTLSNGTQTCICPAHYTGKKCEKIQCLNLGTAIGNKCECVSGFTGQFCETCKCGNLCFEMPLGTMLSEQFVI